MSICNYCGEFQNSQNSTIDGMHKHCGGIFLDEYEPEQYPEEPQPIDPRYGTGGYIEKESEEVK